MADIIAVTQYGVVLLGLLLLLWLITEHVDRWKP